MKDGKFYKFKNSILLSILFLQSSAIHAAIGDNVVTPKKIISQIIIQTGSGSSYYAQADGGWGVADCSGALYAYVDHSISGADAMLSALLTARSTGRPIGFSGICGDPDGDGRYIQIRTVYF